MFLGGCCFVRRERSAEQDHACSDLRETCSCGASICACVPCGNSYGCDGVTRQKMLCDVQSTIPQGCPSSAPNFGDACAPEGILCGNGGCGSDGQNYHCAGGLWSADHAGVACPG